jgi:translation initiation factor IF-2
MRPQQPGGGRPFEQRRGAVPTGTRPGPRTPGRPGMLPPLPDKMPPKAEPGKPLYARKPPQRQRPVVDKREIEGERKLHPTRQRTGADGRRGVAAVVAPPEPRPPRDVTLTEGITIRELAEKLDVRAKDLLKVLLDKGVFASINQALDVQTATDLAQAFNGVVSVVSFEEEMVLEVAKEETHENLKPRPPVVTVMGHVDHGKTSLLDAIRESDVASGEAGGITQHIGAYKVQVQDKAVVFVDTPGHEAFTRMRSRGAKVTDIVVLVVAADDGVMPQTKEAIDHAKAANVPIIVAVNKIDKPEGQPERVKRQLTEAGLMPAEWGGDTEFVEVSAKQKTNVDKLLDTILVVAELRNLKANPDAPASGTVLESRVDKGRGPVATVLVQNGTLRPIVAAPRRKPIRRLPLRFSAFRAFRKPAITSRSQMRPRPVTSSNTARANSVTRRYARRLVGASRSTNYTSNSRPGKSRSCPSSSRPTCKAPPKSSAKCCPSSPPNR